MQIREHRRELAESMATVAEIAPTKEAIAAHVAAAWKGWQDSDVTPEKVSVEKYGEGVDSRNGWDTHIVLIKGSGPFGFTDGPLTPNTKLTGSPESGST